MEIEQPSLASAELEVPAPRFKGRLFELKEIFKSKDVQIPQHEPYQTSTTTTTATSITEESSGTSSTPSLTPSSLTSSGLFDTSGHRSLEIGSNCYMLPTMPLPSNHLETWELEVKSRLEDDLRQWLRTERCPVPLEFCMIRDKGRIGPCIMVVCWDDKTCMDEKGREAVRKKLQKKIRKLQSMRDCPFPCKVVIDRFRLLALTPSIPTTPTRPPEMESLLGVGLPENPLFRSRYIDRQNSRMGAGNQLTLGNTDRLPIQAQVPEMQSTFVSLSIRNEIENGQECTLGGLIIVGDKVYGLTVAHPFARGELNDEVNFPCLPPESDTSEDSDSDESLFNEFNSDRMSMFVDDTGPNHPSFSPEIGKVLTSNDLVGPAAACSYVELQDLDSGGFGSFGAIVASNFELNVSSTSNKPTVQYDWALIDMNRQLLPLQNSYRSPASSKTVEIRDFSNGKPNPGLEVLILGGKSGIQEGKIGQDNVQLRVRGHSFVVTQLVLTKQLEPGDSGSWVVQGDTVLGCVVAGREILATAYMIPISPILDDVASVLGESQVRIYDNSVFRGKTTEPSVAAESLIGLATTLSDTRQLLLEESSKPEVFSTGIREPYKARVGGPVQSHGALSKLHFLLPHVKPKKLAEEQRKKEVENYGFNPNNDSFLGHIGVSAHAGNWSETTEDDSTYRGWEVAEYQVSQRNGNTLASKDRPDDPSANYDSSAPSGTRAFSSREILFSSSHRGSGRLRRILDHLNTGWAVASSGLSAENDLLEGFARAKNNLCSVITGGADVANLRSLSWNWYLAYLQECSARSWKDTIQPVLPLVAAKSGVRSLNATILILDKMAQLAILVQNREKISISQIVSDLDQGAGPNSVQMVFQMIGWMTALWDPAPEPSTKYLTLRQRNHQSRRRTRVRKPVISNYSVKLDSVNQPLYRLLAMFGNLIPVPEFTLRDEASDGVESGAQYISASSISFHNIRTITNVQVEWTDTLAQHLEFEIVHRVLHVFRHPSICLLQYRVHGDTMISKLFKEQQDENFGESIKLLNSYPNNTGTEGFLAEVMLSYRLIFGHDRRSRAAIGQELKGMSTTTPGQLDPLLELLCTRDRRSAEIKELHSLLDSREFEDYVSLNEFPFLGRRLLDLQRLRGRHTLAELPLDRRDITQLFKTWTLLTIGVLTLVLLFIQLMLQI